MNIDKFEERAKEVIVENNLFVPCDDNKMPMISSMFRVETSSFYKDKKLEFCLFGPNCCTFDVRATNFDDLFDKALRVLKAYGPKGTRERKPKEAEEATAQQ